MEIKRRTLQLRIKSLSDDGTFEGLLSPYGNVDDGGDVVEAGAFTKSLAEYGHVVPMLWQHKMDCPIGELSLNDQDDGLYCSGTFILDQDSSGNYLVPEAAKAYALLKAQIIKGLSIGYETVKSQVVNGVRYLKELRLYEGSVVTFPMNGLAGVTAVKATERKGEFLNELTDRQLYDAGQQMLSALASSLYPLPWSGESRDVITASAEAILTEFSAAYLAYLPNYLDFLSREYGLDTKSWSAQREVKEGRTISTATRKSLSDAHEHMKSAVDVLGGLLADEDTPDDLDPDDDLEAKGHADFVSKMIGLLR